jgi:DNA-binding transcriptional MerR regulator
VESGILAASKLGSFISISELAREAGVTQRTLRFYQSKGLLTPARDGNARMFSNEDRNRLNLIQQGKRLGFTLAEIRKMLTANARGTAQKLPISQQDCAKQIELLERQRDEIEHAIAELRQMQSDLRQNAANGDTGPRARAS